MKKLIIANWKMTPQSLAEAEAFFYELQKVSQKLKNMEIVICPPFIYLGNLHEMPHVKLGSQDVFWENPPSGKVSFTGEVSVSMLKNSGAKYVIIGHSERRSPPPGGLGETDEMINKKIKTALKKNLKVLFCVGERERDENGEYLKFVKGQIVAGLDKLSRKDLKNLIMVYEPVWAISSSKNARADTPAELFEMSVYIRRILFFKFGKKIAHSTPILYGGSVDALNAKSFLEKGSVQGLLVGRASQKIKTFIELLKNI